MGSTRAVALIFVLSTLYSECHSAQSDRSRQRSGPIRSVPVAADIKRDTSFECPEEFGYYPHPTDCTQYYVCVFGGALLESCTGGLMYSHELQTCDWPRNVGCDAINPGEADEIERVVERVVEKKITAPPPPPPRRVTQALPPPPLPRAQPNPVVTSRGQPKITREEYVKQQQLYADVDDLPPVEEIESDRQQRVYRGQPSTIGQVQRDRDGYAQVDTGRTLNSNIIPASISQNNGKIGSFSFGTQVEERRPIVTQAPRAFSFIKIDNLTDTKHDELLDFETNDIDKPTILSRRKRNAIETVNNSSIENNSSKTDSLTDRNDGVSVEYEDINDDLISEESSDSREDTDRGKRQIRHGRFQHKHSYKAEKPWENSKYIKFPNSAEYNFNKPTNAQNYRNPVNYNKLNSNSFFDEFKNPSYDYSPFSTSNPFAAYETQYTQSQKPFKPSLPDVSSRKPFYDPINSPTQIITKSPPISSLNNNENPFYKLAGGFLNNKPKQINNPWSTSGTFKNSNNFQSFDSSQVSTSPVTGKPILIQTPRYPSNQKLNQNSQSFSAQYNPSLTNLKPQNHDAGQKYKNENQSEEESDEDESSEEISTENDNSEEDDKVVKYDFPEPPYEFKHPNNKYANIHNPFADPNFDFDAYLAKLSGEKYKTVDISTPKPKYQNNSALKIIDTPIQSTTVSPTKSGFRSSTLSSYHGMSTPRPFSVPSDDPLTWNSHDQHGQSTTKKPENGMYIHHPQHQYNENSNKHLQQIQTVSNRPSNSPGSERLHLKPPNFKDERQLPINYNFQNFLKSTFSPNTERTPFKAEYNKQVVGVNQKPYVVVTGTGSPISFSTIKNPFLGRPSKYLSYAPHVVVTGKPYFMSSYRPNSDYSALKHSTQKPLTTANDELAVLQQFWNTASKKPDLFMIPTKSTHLASEMPSLESLFSQSIKSTAESILSGNKNLMALPPKDSSASTTSAPPTKKPIPKPSPEMNDYYYDDDDEQYYYEPPVKSQYMPSSEVRPQRPQMAQNYQEYDDIGSGEQNTKIAQKPPSRKPNDYNKYNQETVTKNHNDVSIVTKSPYKEIKHFNKNTSDITYITRPEISNYAVMHQSSRNRTMFYKKPMDLGPNTIKPPRYLNQTTLRPYTVRHRLAKPTAVTQTPSSQTQDIKTSTKGRTRHPNIVTQMRLTTPRDNHNQETRYTKTRHDGKTNSLEPTESVIPTQYTASPRPKMLYNGSQNYSPDQYDPYYAVYDEDGELYKDTDYVQQYNLASLRPAVQQTYRGTPPPARRPVETYTTRPVSPDDYDDALIQGQVNNQAQYQNGIRHTTRGEGNELEFDNNPITVRTTIFEAPPSTTPSTTITTTTTTQRPTVAPITEAMTPSRFTIRSSTDEHPVSNNRPSSLNNQLYKTAFPSSVPLTYETTVNISSLAKPFQKTENLYRLRNTSTSTEKSTQSPLTHTSNVEDSPKNNIDKDHSPVSLSSGFSIRRNPNNTNNPYTLTVHTRPFDTYAPEKNRKYHISEPKKNVKQNKPLGTKRLYYSHEDQIGAEKLIDRSDEISDISMRRTNSPELITDEQDIPIFIRPTAKLRVVEPRDKTSTSPTTTLASKYFLKTVIKRPVPFATNNQLQNNIVSTENSIDTESLIEKALQNSQYKDVLEPNTEKKYSKNYWDNPSDNQYQNLENKQYNAKEQYIVDTTTSSSTTHYTTFKPLQNEKLYDQSLAKPTNPSYYRYTIAEDVTTPTSDIFSTTAKNLLKAFFNSFSSTPKPKTIRIVNTPSKPNFENERVVNIGFNKKYLKYDENPIKSNNQRLQIITESTLNKFVSPTLPAFQHKYKSESEYYSTVPVTTQKPEITSTMVQSTTTNRYNRVNIGETQNSKFSELVNSDKEDSTNEQPDLNLYSLKFHNIVSDKPFRYNLNQYNNDFRDDVVTTTIGIDNDNNKIKSDYEKTERPKQLPPTTTTSTTPRPIEQTTVTKSPTFPTRASRVNPAIKLAATNPGGGRRSYQSSSNCSSDNSLQENPKCNEIKYQRPSSTRGRGTAHYSTSGGNEAAPHRAQEQQAPNRGTPPTRSRPTLKPSTAIVSKSSEFVDIYANPPRRPSAVYPQPTPDKTAAKCRKDVCLLPDCYCGGKDIPGDLPVENIPQIVLLTFDDSVNDLNKGLYTDLFEKGRVNPNGCPISATFYVSHEWTDYSQVQNLYAAGHELASHTVSHSFGEQFSQKKWYREVGGQREILAAYGGVKLEDVRGMRAPFLSVGGNKMFKMLYDANFTYDSSLPVYENRPPSWPYTLDYKLFHDCMIPPCPTKSYPGVWEVPMVMWQDLNGGRCSMGDACANPPNAEGVYKMILKNFDRHYTTNRAPFGLYYHAAWFTQPHHKEGFIMFLDFINRMNDVWIVTNWQALQWVRDPTPNNRMNNFQPFQCDYADRPKKCNNPKVCNLWHKSGVRYMRTCQPCPEVYPWTGKTGIRSSRIDNDIEE